MCHSGKQATHTEKTVQSKETGQMSTSPNILFILTDNQRADLLGCAGNDIIQTPHLDRLAAEGVRFENAFATTPICAASRASYLTGLYERRHQFTFLTPPLRREFSDISYPALLKSSGYHTGFIGKFGVARNGPEPSLEDEGALSNMFDHFDNYEHWTDEGYEIPQPDGSIRHLTDITGDNSVAFLEEHAEAHLDRPFCLSISFNAPHAQDGDPRHYIWSPPEDDLYVDADIPAPANDNPDFFDALPPFIRESESRVRWHTRFDTPENHARHIKGLYRMVSGIDRNVGRLLETLDRLGLADDTIIIYTSDHGMYYGDRGLSDCWQMNDPCLRIPMIVHDHRIERARVCSDLALNIDIAPTILDLCGLDIPDGTQGQSLVPLLTGQKTEWRTSFLCEHLFNRSDIPKSEGVRTTRWKYIRYFEQSPAHEELYDLSTDPNESINLAGVTEYAEQLDQLRQQCDQSIARAR